MTTWNPDSYLKYQDERTQPSYDLAARVELPSPAKIIDIGCGPGNSTRVLRERWPHARITGLDNSPEMIEKARKTFPQEHWILADAATWNAEERYDLVFSNAALQWIPNHEALVSKLFTLVDDRGALAVQVPANSESPIHQALLKVSKVEEWREYTSGCDRTLNYHNASFYYDQLSAIAGRMTMWQTIYYHVMASHQGLIDWYASTAMRPYLERLPSDAQKKSFQAQVLAECRPHYPWQQDHKILFPFNRLFFVAYRGEAQ